MPIVPMTTVASAAGNIHGSAMPASGPNAAPNTVP
jgi:hypothetical protein